MQSLRTGQLHPPRNGVHWRGSDSEEERPGTRIANVSYGNGSLPCTCPNNVRGEFGADSPARSAPDSPSVGSHSSPETTPWRAYFLPRSAAWAPTSRAMSWSAT
ncbi:hypothetical protein ACFFX0_13710 [Citricoccus parietis]|uniref:Uncharacterized protein n=1 Tax=Citricoccus parietis TaxID=592307 RepID=A0ABV5FZT1_9MICC